MEQRALVPQWQPVGGHIGGGSPLERWAETANPATARTSRRVIAASFFTEISYAGSSRKTRVLREKSVAKILKRFHLFDTTATQLFQETASKSEALGWWEMEISELSI
jgi:hypothetical protein